MKSQQLQVIDYAISMTRNKGGQFNSLGTMSSALKHYYHFAKSEGFTSNGNARKYMETLSNDDIEKELLIGIIKKQACATKNGYNQKLSTNKTFNDDLTVEDTELLLIGTITQDRMEVVKYLLDKYPKLINNLIDSFVDTRYFSPQYGIEQLDQEFPYYQNMLDKIENYYAGLKVDQQPKQY